MTATEPSRYFTTFQETRRDRFLIVGVRYVMPASRVLAFEPMAGLAITFAEASSGDLHRPFFPRPAGPKVTMT